MRWRSIGVGLAIVASVVAIVGYRIVDGLSLDALRPVLERELTEGLRLEVEITGVPRIELIPALRLVVEDVRVARPPASLRPCSASAGSSSTC